MSDGVRQLGEFLAGRCLDPAKPGCSIRMLNVQRFAKEQNVDLIVVGTHGQHGLTALLGSTTEGVAHMAPCDVLVIRAHGSAG